MQSNDAEKQLLPGRSDASGLMGVAGLVVSMIGFAFCLFTVLYCTSLSVDKPGPNPIEGNILPPGSFSFLHLLFVSVIGLVGGVTGGAISIIGFMLSLVSVFDRRNSVAKIGMLVGLAGPLLMWFALTRW